MVKMPDITGCDTPEKLRLAVCQYAAECGLCNEEPQGLSISLDQWKDMNSEHVKDWKWNDVPVTPWGWHRLYSVPVRVEGYSSLHEAMENGYEF